MVKWNFKGTDDGARTAIAESAEVRSFAPAAKDGDRSPEYVRWLSQTLMGPPNLVAYGKPEEACTDQLASPGCRWIMEGQARIAVPIIAMMNYHFTILLLVVQQKIRNASGIRSETYHTSRKIRIGPLNFLFFVKTIYSCREVGLTGLIHDSLQVDPKITNSSTLSGS